MTTIEVKVPDIGDFDEVEVIELLTKVGYTVKAEQSLITVEIDKASLEILSSTAGAVKELRVALGDKVQEGSVVLAMEAASDTAASVPAVTPATAASAPVAALAPRCRLLANLQLPAWCRSSRPTLATSRTCRRSRGLH